MSTLIKSNGLFQTPAFFDDFLTRNLFDFSRATGLGQMVNNTSVPRVNMIETNDDFRVEMAAPGMKKDDFHLELDNDMLTISADVQNESANEQQKITRLEFNYQCFKRSFYLPNTVEADKIEATYENGILGLIIPKKEEVRKKPVRTIRIS